MPSDPIQPPTYKQQVAASFGGAAATYDAYAVVQQTCARQLVACLGAIAPTLPPGPILEIGCGTGFVTRDLVSKLSDRPLVITDLSPAMLEHCRRSLPVELSDRVTFAPLDAEALAADPRLGKQQYAAIVGGFVVQWFSHPAHSLRALATALQPGGLLLVTFPTPRSFDPWRQLCAEVQVPFTGNPLPDPEDLVLDLTAAGLVCRCQRQSVSVGYTGAIAFLNSLKQIGAGLSRSHPQLSTAQLRRLIRHWDQHYPNGVEVCYEAAILSVRSKD